MNDGTKQTYDGDMLGGWEKVVAAREEDDHGEHGGDPQRHFLPALAWNKERQQS